MVILESVILVNVKSSVILVNVKSDNTLMMSPSAQIGRDEPHNDGNEKMEVCIKCGDTCQQDKIRTWCY